jgi:hypothetical protein
MIDAATAARFWAHVDKSNGSNPRESTPLDRAAIGKPFSSSPQCSTLKPRFHNQQIAQP